MPPLARLDFADAELLDQLAIFGNIFVAEIGLKSSALSDEQ